MDYAQTYAPSPSKSAQAIVSASFDAYTQLFAQMQGLGLGSMSAFVTLVLMVCVRLFHRQLKHACSRLCNRLLPVSAPASRETSSTVGSPTALPSHIDDIHVKPVHAIDIVKESRVVCEEQTTHAAKSSSTTVSKTTSPVASDSDTAPKRTRGRSITPRTQKYKKADALRIGPHAI
jgi:hypothetical protein